MSDLNAEGRMLVFDTLGEQLISGEEYQFSIADKDMALKGQMDGEELCAFQVWPGDGSTLFLSFAANKTVTPRRAGLMCAKLIIDWADEQEELDATDISHDLYQFLASDEGQELWEGN